MKTKEQLEEYLQKIEEDQAYIIEQFMLGFFDPQQAINTLLQVRAAKNTINFILSDEEVKEEEVTDEQVQDVPNV